LVFDGVDYNADDIVAAIPLHFTGVRDPQCDRESDFLALY